MRLPYNLRFMKVNIVLSIMTWNRSDRRVQQCRQTRSLVMTPPRRIAGARDLFSQALSEVPNRPEVVSLSIRPEVRGFFDARTDSVQYVVSDPTSPRCAIIDPVLDFDEKSGSTATRSADAILDYVRRRGFTIDWILDTHPHADHFSAAGYLKDVTGAPTAIGERVVDVQRLWKATSNLESLLICRQCCEKTHRVPGIREATAALEYFLWVRSALPRSKQSLNRCADLATNA